MTEVQQLKDGKLGSLTNHKEVLRELRFLRNVITKSSTTSGYLPWAQLAATGDKTLPHPCGPLFESKPRKPTA
jgi:hypothetical protein